MYGTGFRRWDRFFIIFTARKGNGNLPETSRKRTIPARIRLVSDRELDDNHWIPVTGMTRFPVDSAPYPARFHNAFSESGRNPMGKMPQCGYWRCRGKRPIPVRFRYAESHVCFCVQWIFAWNVPFPRETSNRPLKILAMGFITWTAS